MKRMMAFGLILSLGSIGLVGCGDKTSTKEEVKVTTPGGTTTTTVEKDVKKTGDNPPPARP
jgi:ABC-type glycerol-3-phosphate transport system substrate-binding protein